MTYSVKEIFYSLQGEGANSGRATIFCRFSGCNLWSGREVDRLSAVCQFCDTDFIGVEGEYGGKYKTALDLVNTIEKLWDQQRLARQHRMIVCTGGEPLLQLDNELIQVLRDKQFYIAVESNGTIAPPSGIDWLCVSPKSDAVLVAKAGDELKLIFPQQHMTPEDYKHLAFRYFYLQPKASEGYDYTDKVVEYCLQNPQWRLSLQTHKMLGIE